MTLRDRVATTGRTLALIASGRSALLAVASGVAAAGVLRIIGIGPAVAAGFGALLGAVVGWWIYARIRGAGFGISAVSLWIEEHVPALGYGLVTAVESGAPPALERTVGVTDWSSVTREAARKALRLPMLALLAAIGLYAASSTFEPAVSRFGQRVIDRDRSVAALPDVSVQVVPPSYTRRRNESLRNPPVVRALVGGDVQLSVAGGGAFELLVSDQRVAGASWHVTAQPVALRVRVGDASRLIAIDPVTDSAPSIQLREPVRDTVLLTPNGTFTLGAGVRDDIGLGRGRFEYIVSSGSGESFTFASGTIGETRFDGAGSGLLSGQLSLASLKLKPGDFVHIRAVAWDLRDDTASARGTSETRTIRIARTGEYDSVSVDAAAPPEAEKAVLSQRMLINMAEALVRRRPRLQQSVFTDESRSIARDQARLRKLVGDLIFVRLGADSGGEHDRDTPSSRKDLTLEELLKAAEEATAAAAGQALDFEGDETPVVAVNRPLLEAYNFMWDAGRELDQSSPQRALPAMYRALDAIQRARAAERLYLRSRPPRAVVDVERARLQGKEKGTPDAREPRTPVTGVARAALARFARVVRLAEASPMIAADSLLLLRIDMLGSIPAEAATAAATAADQLRNGQDATANLGILRRSLGVPLVRVDSLSRWTGVR